MFRLKGLIKYFVSGAVPVVIGLLLIRVGGLAYKNFAGNSLPYPAAVVLLFVGFGAGKVVCDPIANRYGEDKIDPPKE